MTDVQRPDDKLARVKPSDLCQIEIFVGKLKPALEFYEKVFGWKKIPAYIHDLCVLDTGDSNIGLALIPKASAKQSASQQSASKQIRLTFKISCEKKLRTILENAAAYNLHGNQDSSSDRASVGQQKKRKNVAGLGSVYFITDPDGHELGLFVRKTSQKIAERKEAKAPAGTVEKLSKNR